MSCGHFPSFALRISFTWGYRWHHRWCLGDAWQRWWYWLRCQLRVLLAGRWYALGWQHRVRPETVGLHVISTIVGAVHRHQVFPPHARRVRCWRVYPVRAAPVTAHPAETLSDANNAGRAALPQSDQRAA